MKKLNKTSIGTAALSGLQISPENMIKAAMNYAELLRQRFENSMDSRCLRHVHDGNPCKRCKFIRIEEY